MCPASSSQVGAPTANFAVEYQATSSLSTVASGTWACGRICGSIFDCLQRLDFDDSQPARPLPYAPVVRRYHRLSNLRNSIAKLEHPFFSCQVGPES
ncbi:hypothetical protein GALMADRAFT_260298 [Galerina marginata CBS 339.88]|uniref:Uncharacterized protein n=1 Tax=Galerina marginata (strain CBS 339.88) TaxID=685588 RepID=A0A067S5Q4_GALM3|nr:hypothetical protein GALMADRAFT_260298 [Galerina marginata CBS 339.88]